MVRSTAEAVQRRLESFRRWAGGIELGLNLARATFQTLFVLGIAVLDPFAMSEKAKESARDFALRVTAPFYAREAQERIVVILIDDEDLNSDIYGFSKPLPWPLPPAVEIALLRTIATYGPRAVFIDLLYGRVGDDPAGFQDLLRTMDVYRTQFPIYVAANPGSARGDGVDGVLPEVAATVALAPTDWCGPPGEYPLAVGSRDGTVRLTPAAAMYRDALRAGVTAGGSATEAETLQRLLALEAPRPWPPGATWCDGAPHTVPTLQVQWGWWTSDKAEYAAIMRPCPNWRGNEKSNWCVAAEHLWRGASAGLRGGSLAMELGCYSHTTINLRSLANMPDDRKAYIFTDAFVIIGARLDGANDFVLSPAIGRIPGAHLHAMALDNLLTEGFGFLRKPETIFGAFTWQDVSLIIIGFTQILIANIIAYSSHKNSSKENEIDCAVVCIKGILLLQFFMLIICMFIILFEWFYMRWAPYNIVALLAVWFAVFVIIVDDLILIGLRHVKVACNNMKTRLTRKEHLS